MSGERQWQAAEGSSVLHLVIPATGSRRSGPRAVCGRYPQRGRDYWWGLSESEVTDLPGIARRLSLVICRACQEATP